MAKEPLLLVSVVVPVFNEASGLKAFNDSLIEVLDKNYKNEYELLYVNDGSTDSTASLVAEFAAKNKAVGLLSLSRNFGKEIATTAGLHAAAGQAVITIDADNQHPPELIPDFVEKWRAGSKVVVGVRMANKNEGFTKRYGSKLFYWLFNRFTSVNLVAGATDYRLIDSSVQKQFNKMTERNRITRGLIDWLGYNRTYIYFKANARLSGDAGYSIKKLFRLAIDSVVSLSLSPLYISAYIGGAILPLSVLLGLFMVIDALIGDPTHLHATGSAYLVVLMLFLVGVLLVSQGIIGIYLSHIHTEAQNRPIYIVDKENSLNV